MTKKITTTILVIIILVAVGVLIGFLIIKDTPQGQSVEETVKNYFPFGKVPVNDGAINNQSGSGNLGGETAPALSTIPRLRKISDSPVAGATVMETPLGTTTIITIRYIERATGNVYDAKIGSVEPTRISNTTIPKIYEALWALGGDTVIIRNLRDNGEDIQTLSAKLSRQTGTSSDPSLKQLTGTFLPFNIKEVVVSPSGKRLFYLLENADGATGIISNTDGSSATKTFDSPLGEWLASWPNENTITLATKPAADTDGFLYFLNSKTGKLDGVFGKKSGLTALVSPDTARVLYAEGSRGGILTKIFAVKDGADNSLQLRTLPEKCVWSKKEVTFYCGVPRAVAPLDYPEEWYQGLVSFSDDIWKINGITGSSTKVADISEPSGAEIDVIKPILTAKEDYLIFINKKDSALWSLRIAEN